MILGLGTQYLFFNDRVVSVFRSSDRIKKNRSHSARRADLLHLQPRRPSFMRYLIKFFSIKLFDNAHNSLVPHTSVFGVLGLDAHQI